MIFTHSLSSLVPSPDLSLQLRSGQALSLFGPSAAPSTTPSVSLRASANSGLRLIQGKLFFAQGKLGRRVSFWESSRSCLLSVPTTVWDSPGLRESTRYLRCRSASRPRSPVQTHQAANCPSAAIDRAGAVAAGHSTVVVPPH